MQNKKLFLFTSEYPYKTGETFIENELKEFSKKFNKIYIAPITLKTDVNRFVPHNAEVVNLFESLPSKRSSKIFFENLFYIIKVLFSEFVHTSKKKYFLKNIRLFNSFLCQNIERAEYVQRFLIQKNITQDNTVFYSFWMNEGAMIFSILKDKKQITDFVFRVSGYDLYDDRRKGGYMPFRYFNISRTNKVFCVSKVGMEYLKQKNVFPQKITYSYFGTYDYGLSKFDNSNIFTLYSCSSIIPLKRIELIVEVLKNIKFDTKWIHRGSGPQRELLLELVKTLPNNVTFELLDWAKDYNEVIEHVKNTSINLCINVSNSEGLPVTLMEAASFGIPIIATNVGGTSEVVNKNTGILIDKDFSPTEVAAMITNFKDSEMNTFDFRKNVKAYWEDNFSAIKNYEKFYQELINSNN